MSKIFIFVILSFFSITILAAENWYAVKTWTPLKAYTYHGTIDLSRNDLIKSISDEEFILIENLVYFDNQNKAKSWSEWAPHQKSEVLIRGENILTIHPMNGDPRK